MLIQFLQYLDHRIYFNLIILSGKQKL